MRLVLGVLVSSAAFVGIWSMPQALMGAIAYFSLEALDMSVTEFELAWLVAGPMFWGTWLNFQKVSVKDESRFTIQSLFWTHFFAGLFIYTIPTMMILGMPFWVCALFGFLTYSLPICGCFYYLARQWVKEVEEGEASEAEPGREVE